MASLALLTGLHMAGNFREIYEQNAHGGLPQIYSWPSALIVSNWRSCVEANEVSRRTDK